MDGARVVEYLEIALLVGSVASLYFTPRVWRWVVRRARAFVSSCRAFGALPEAVMSLNKLQALDSSVSRVLREVLPNGGSSLRDAVNSIHTRQEEQMLGITDLKHSVMIQVGVMRAHYDADGTYARFETDGLGRNTWVNRTYLRWVNRSLEQMLGYGWINAVAPEHREIVREEWELAVSERREFAMRYKLQTNYGITFEVDCVAAPVVGEDPYLPERWVGYMMRLEPSYEDS